MLATKKGSFVEYFAEMLGVEAHRTGNVEGGLLFTSIPFDREGITRIVNSYFYDLGYEVKEEKIAGDKEGGLFFTATKSGEKRICITIARDGDSLLVHT